MGKALLLRDNRNVSITQAGLAFLPYAERVVRLFQESRLTLSEQFEHYIVLSGPGVVWHYRYLESILAFRRCHPNVAVKFLSYIDASYMIRDLLLDGTVHVAVRYDPADHPKVSKVLLFEEEIILVSNEKGRRVNKADFRSADYCHTEWGGPFPEWFAEMVGPGYIPALQTDHSSIMLTMLLQERIFGFMPRSVVQPYLDNGLLFEADSDIHPPAVSVYASYLTEKQEQPSVRFGLQLLGIQLSTELN
ncbi:LysR family transcriptional regulator [Paenibacillus sp. M1]|uniref:LysR family transcriptional regulator n=1 Tax=Paenibacillus haidiansis TaxID=1574488 RepID=A0ABU7VPK3_9BACL